MANSDLEVPLKADRFDFSVNRPPPAERSRRDKWRSYSAQIIASTVKNLLLLDLGLSVAFPAMVIPALEQKSHIALNETSSIAADHPSEGFFLTDEQITWFSSIAFICQPLGGVLSGWITEPYGRKKAMFIVNFPFMAGWIMLYLSTSVAQVIIATVLMGLGVGFMEAAVLTYVGEIAEPAIRGVLASVANLSVTLGVFVIYFLGTVLYWRTAAIICLSVPIITAVAICFVPETPLWLLSQGRKSDAIKALQWLRGWTTYEAVAEEFHTMEEHHRVNDLCVACDRSGIAVCEHSRSTFANRMRELGRPATIKPFLIINICSFFAHLAGVTAIRQYYVQVFETYDVPINAKTATVITGFIGMFGTIFLMVILKKIGKRLACLISFAGMMACEIALGVYAFNEFPQGQTSFDRSNIVHEGKGMLPMVLLFATCFLFTIGSYSIPWMLLSEMFPFKSRGLATGISAALNYFFAFIAIKTYRYVELGFGMAGASWLYAAFALAGFVAMYLTLPETEGLTLEDIERHFSTKGRKLTDRKIHPYQRISLSYKE